MINLAFAAVPPQKFITPDLVDPARLYPLGYGLMDPAATLRTARLASGLSQTELAARTGTSQATVSLYESGRKQPAVATLKRLLRAADWELTANPRWSLGARRLTPEQIAEVDRKLIQVLELADSLPVRHEQDLRFPRMPAPTYPVPS